jgi:uncharacterized protein (TIGR03032 family)
VSSDQPSPEPASFSSLYTENFPALLRELGVSLLVSTYQAGRLIVVRPQGDELNTHFCVFRSPMGIAFNPAAGRLALGTLHEVWHFQNQPGVAAKLAPAGSHDAAFLPRHRHYSGDIRIHEIAWAGDELWAVNTRFSCLCTFDGEHSFVPRWRPPFVTALAPEDRCHLNGFAILDGGVRYATCLGLTDTAGGWRENKANGGCVLQVPSGDPVITGLSMPHSPRRHRGGDWLLESGAGAFCHADFAAGTHGTVARLPGFTRGLDFAGDYAFIGLSQVRETATFSGLPLLEQNPEPSCGVWVIHLPTGRIAAFLRFEGIVQEIFAVQVLPFAHPTLIHEPGPELASSFILPPEAIAQLAE